MNIVGHTKDGDFIDFLKEATITCSLSELEAIASTMGAARGLHLRSKCKRHWAAMPPDDSSVRLCRTELARRAHLPLDELG